MTDIYNDISNSLSFKDIATIFSAHLKCLECGGCDNCILNENKIEGYRIGCLKLRDIAMKKIIDIFGDKGVVDGKNNR